MAKSQVPVLFMQLGSSTVVGIGRPIDSAYSFSANNAFAIKSALSPVIRSMIQTASISIRYVQATMYTMIIKTISNVSPKLPDNLSLSLKAI